MIARFNRLRLNITLQCNGYSHWPFTATICRKSLAIFQNIDGSVASGDFDKLLSKHGHLSNIKWFEAHSKSPCKQISWIYPTQSNIVSKIDFIVPTFIYVTFSVSNESNLERSCFGNCEKCKYVHVLDKKNIVNRLTNRCSAVSFHITCV